MEKIIYAKVYPNSKENKIVELSPDRFEIYTKEPAINNRANLAATIFLSEHFKIEKNQVILIKGHNQPKKTFKIYFR